jgi:branched-chain amino acid transport system permease protein
MSYLLFLGTMLGIYAVLAYSLNLTAGLGGLLPFCHAAFYGIGAYTYALLTIGHLPPALALPLAVATTGILAAVIGMFSLRFRSDLFLFATLSFQMVVFALLHNWVDVTNGPYGLHGIARPQIFGFVATAPEHFFILAGVMNLVTLPILFAVYRSSFGRVLRALREDEDAAEAMGIRAQSVHLQAFVLSAAVAAIPGAFLASWIPYIDPSSFSLDISIFLVVMLLLGGAGNRVGPLVGAAVMLLLPEALRFVGLPDTVASNVREVIFGAALIFLMYLRPTGIAGETVVR